MIPALLTPLFFALSVVVARRSAQYLGSQPANLARQVVALLVLACWAYSFGQGLHGVSLAVMIMSGVIGFGLGDWALFEALPRIGAPLTALLSQCLAAPIAAVTEWLWLGTTLLPIHIAASLVTLVGVALAVAPERNSDLPAGHRVLGVVFGVIAAAGQAWGAVLSRYGFLQAEHAAFNLDPYTAAYQRLLGGVASIGALMFIRYLLGAEKPLAPSAVRQAWPWVVSNALAGPVIGVSCYLLALKSLTSAVVLPVVATTPLVANALSFFIDGTVPSRRAIIGSVIAVTGVIILVSFTPHNG